jgi:hypothetical protein
MVVALSETPPAAPAQIAATTHGAGALAAELEQARESEQDLMRQLHETVETSERLVGQYREALEVEKATSARLRREQDALWERLDGVALSETPPPAEDEGKYGDMRDSVSQGWLGP